MTPLAGKMARRTRPLLGTYVTVTLWEQPQPEQFDAAFAAISHIRELLSFHDAGSDLSRLNLSRGEQVRIHPQSLRVLCLALTMSRKSGGLFNPTVGGSLVAAGILPDHGFGCRLPVGHAGDVAVGPGYARLLRPVLVTLDGIAKGYAVDCAVAALLQTGARAGIVNAGGDLRVFGECAVPLHVAGEDDLLRPAGFLHNAAVATSGMTERHDPDRPGWIVAPGQSPSACGNISVLAARTWRADALTKVAACAPTHARQQWLAKLGGRLVEPLKPAVNPSRSPLLATRS